MQFVYKNLLLLSIAFVLTSGIPVKKNPIYGTWKITSGKHNGTNAPKSMMDRTQSFTLENTFQSLIKTAEGKIYVGNSGKFYLITDTTMVTYHNDLSGKPGNVANTYNFQIRNDSLHFYGFYLSQTPANPLVLNKVYIDEWWVRSEQKK
jgi:hypothetical protein